MNLLITRAFIKESLLREKTSLFETSHTSDSSGGESHTVGWRAGVELRWPALVKISSESRDMSGKKEEWALVRVTPTLGPRQQERYCHFFCKPGLHEFWFPPLRSSQCHLGLHIQGIRGQQRQTVTAYTPQQLCPGIMALGDLVSLELGFICSHCTQPVPPEAGTRRSMTKGDPSHRMRELSEFWYCSP